MSRCYGKIEHVHANRRLCARVYRKFPRATSRRYALDVRTNEDGRGGGGGGGMIRERDDARSWIEARASSFMPDIYRGTTFSILSRRSLKDRAAPHKLAIAAITRSLLCYCASTRTERERESERIDGKSKKKKRKPAQDTGGSSLSSPFLSRRAAIVINPRLSLRCNFASDQSLQIASQHPSLSPSPSKRSPCGIETMLRRCRPMMWNPVGIQFPRCLIFIRELYPFNFQFARSRSPD